MERICHVVVLQMTLKGDTQQRNFRLSSKFFGNCWNISYDLWTIFANCFGQFRKSLKNC